MIIKLDITDNEIAEKVLNIQIPSYSVEATLIGFNEIPLLKETIDSLKKCGETFFGFLIEGELAGAISFKIEGHVLDIHRLMVHPNHFRKGIAKALFYFVEHNFGDLSEMIVSTGTDNIPAVNFYQNFGFVISGKRTVAENLSLTSFLKRMK